MAPRFDDERCRIELSVADLLERELTGSLGFGNRGGFERLWLGQAIHSQYQESALGSDQTYRREVVLAVELVHRGWEVHLAGRADGLRREPDGTLVVEEIKSLRRGSQLAPTTRELYARQALVYAWMLHRQGEEKVRAELVLIEIGSDRVEREEVEIDFPALEKEVKRRVAALLHAREQARAAAEERRRVGTELAFPYPELRRGQSEIVAAVEGALERGDHLLVEAPTGIGKTVSALYPALRHALANDQRVFVLTAKTLQQDMAMKVMALLNGAEGFHALRLRAKAKMCANSEVICHEEYCAYARDYYGKLRTQGTVQRILADHATLEPEAVFAAARADEVCPFEVSLDLSRQAQVVACDYNYAFDPYVALTDFAADADLSNVVLVIDEVHNLVERGRAYYSPQLSSAAARRVEAAVRWGGTPLHAEMADVAAALAELVERVAEDHEPLDPRGDWSVEAMLPDEELWRLRPRFDTAFVDYLEHQRETRSFSAEDPFVGLYFDLLRFLDVLLLLDEAFSTLVSRVGEEARLQVLCKDPSRFLAQVISRTHSTIGLSATLSPAEFYRDLIGFEPERTATLSLPNPFPAENRCVVIDPTVETTWKQRPFHTPRIAEQLSRFAAAVPGNCLALFPSYDFLAAVASRLDVPGKRVLVQQRADSDQARQEILEALRGSLFGETLLLAVAGGVFAEGVDYPGQMLQAVAVVGPCLPAVSLERQLLKDYFDQRFERGFEYAFVVPGMTRVVQAVGRLLRSPEDRGIIALLDRRFLAEPYRAYLPREWTEAAGLRGLVDNPAAAAGRFFRRAG